ncbi:MAG: hypothetical protein ACLT98_04905 [Eggerthellaceae bacterium]
MAKRGLAKNRSEVIRDLVRDALSKRNTRFPGRSQARHHRVRPPHRRCPRQARRHPARLLRADRHVHACAS